MDGYDLLKAAGGFPGRCVDITADEQALNVKGYPIHDAAVAVLREFSGLSIDGLILPEAYPRRENQPFQVGGSWVDGVWVNGEYQSAGWCEGYSQAVNDVLVPVGVESHMTVMVGEHGVVWGAFDAQYGWIADSFVGAVEHIFMAPLGKMALDRELSPDSPAMVGAREYMQQQRKLFLEERAKQSRFWKWFS